MHRLSSPVNKDMNEQYIHICIYTHTLHYTCPPYFGYDGEHVTFAMGSILGEGKSHHNRL